MPRANAPTVAEIRRYRDPARKAVSSKEAGHRLGLTRFTAAERIRTGRVPGYGVRSDERGARTHWYAYDDSLPPAATNGDQGAAALAAERDHYRAKSSAFEEALLRLLAAEEKRREAEQHRAEAADLMAMALLARNKADEANRAADAEKDEALRQIVLPRGVPT